MSVVSLTGIFVDLEARARDQLETYEADERGLLTQDPSRNPLRYILISKVAGLYAQQRTTLEELEQKVREAVELSEWESGALLRGTCMLTLKDHWALLQQKINELLKTSPIADTVRYLLQQRLGDSNSISELITLCTGLKGKIQALQEYSDRLQSISKALDGKSSQKVSLIEEVKQITTIFEQLKTNLESLHKGSTTPLEDDLRAINQIQARLGNYQRTHGMFPNPVGPPQLLPAARASAEEMIASEEWERSFLMKVAADVHGMQLDTAQRIQHFQLLYSGIQDLQEIAMSLRSTIDLTRRTEEMAKRLELRLKPVDPTASTK